MMNAIPRGKPYAGQKFLFAAAISAVAVGAFAEDAYLQSTGVQAIDTGYCANPKTGVTADFAFTSATPTQQKVFGADVDTGQDPDNRCFSFSTYINGSGYYAWACCDGKGNWTPYDGNNTNPDAKADTRRRTVVLDSYNKVAKLLTGGAETASRAIGTTRTRTSPRTLAIFADNDGDKFTPSNMSTMKLYSFKIEDEGKLARLFIPYAKGNITGLKDVLTGEVYPSCNGLPFLYGGDIGILENCGLETAPEGFFLHDGALVDAELWRLNGDDLEFAVSFSCPSGTVTVDGETAPSVVKWVKRGTSQNFSVVANVDPEHTFVSWQGKTSAITTGDAVTASVTVTADSPTALSVRPGIAGDPYADATSLIRFDGVGTQTADSFRSAVGSPTPWSSVVTHNAGIVSNETVVLPYRGTVMTAPTLYLPHPFTVTNAENNAGTGRTTTISLNNFTPGVGVASGDFTLMVRFRPDSNQYRLDNIWMLNWGYSSTASGFLVGLYGKKDLTTVEIPNGAVTNKVTYRKFQMSLFKSGNANTLSALDGLVWGEHWHDLILSFDSTHRKIRYVFCREGYNPKTDPRVTTGYASDNGGQMTYTGEGDMGETCTFTPSANMLLGSESSRDAAFDAILGVSESNVNFTKTFRGSFHQIATWNRAMSTEEMKAALAWPRSDLMRVGVRDGKADEFRGGTATAQDAREWTLPTSFASGDSATITFLTDHTGEEAMQQLFRWYPAADSAAGQVKLSVNGTDVGTLDVMPGETAYLKVKGGLLSAGTNTLTLTRTDTGTGALKLDAAALGGSWQMGDANNTYTEFAAEWLGIVNHDVLDGNWRSIKRVLFGNVPDATGYASDRTNVVYHFTTPAEFRNGNFSWRLSWKDGPNDSRFKPLLRINGTQVYSGTSDGKLHTLDVPTALLQEGDNKLEMCNQTTYVSGVYYWYDYVRLEIVPHRGMMILIR